MNGARMEHKVIDVRATGVLPGVVAEQIEHILNVASSEGWKLQMIQPIVYNSSTTGYVLLIFERPMAPTA